ncbi:hypothetical protein ABK040_006637 [Willaertia magna]
MQQTSEKVVIGRREIIHFPDLGIFNMVGKVDSGAKTSCVDTCNVKINIDSQTISFDIILDRKDRTKVKSITDLPIKSLDGRKVKSSTGHLQSRYVITTKVCVGDKVHGHEQTVELTLVERESLECPVLIGRNLIIASNFLIDCSVKYKLGTRKKIRTDDNIKQITSEITSNTPNL